MHLILTVATVLLIGCGSVELDRHRDTSGGPGVDPFGLCDHVEQELANACSGEELDLFACVTECVDAGGQGVAPYNTFDDCVHEASNEGSCAAQRACLEALGATCIAGT
jgi:hypothetical protein